MNNTEFINTHPHLEDSLESINKSLFNMVSVVDTNNWLFFAGNGGSHSDALHIVGELCKSFERKRGSDFTPSDIILAANVEYGIKAMTLGANSALSSAIINDIGGDNVFAQELYALGSEGDLVFLISTSGNSKNLINTALIAKHKKIKIISLTGPNDSELSKLSDICIQAPGNSTREIQENHIIIWHHICAEIEKYKFPNSQSK